MSKKHYHNTQVSSQESELPAKQVSGSGVVSTANDEYLARRNAIADAADEFRAKEFDDEDFDYDNEDTVQETHSEEDEGEEAQAQEPKKFTIKVNGKMMELTEEELIARAQKVESADQYLQSASEAVKNAANMALSSKDEPDEDDVALARAIQMGSEEEATQAIRKLKAKPSVSTDAVAQSVIERLSFTQAADKFKAEYKEELSDPFLKQLIYSRDSELAEQEPGLGFTERLERVGKEVREWKASISGAPKVNKAERKAQMSNVPSAAARQSMGKDEEQDDSPDSVIAQMAKARGQGRSIQH